MYYYIARPDPRLELQNPTRPDLEKSRLEAISREAVILARTRDVNELGPSPQVRKPAGAFPSPPGPQYKFYSLHLQNHQYFF